jgi:hypothetical protein
MATERVRVVRHPSGGLGPDYYAPSPRVIPGRFVSTGESVEPVQSSSYDLVEPMRYLFVRVVRVRGIRACEGPYVKVQAGPHSIRSRPGRDLSGTGNPEWNQVFAISHARPEPTLEISVWDGGAPSPAEAFLGGVCFDLSDVPVRDQPDGPLAPQWYRLEGGEPGMVTGDIMVAVWIGTQADDAFPEAWNTDAPYAAYTRSKVYQSPKLWYLRASVIEAQDLRVPAPPPGLPFDVRVKIQLGFQSARTRRSVASSSGSAFAWSEDLMFVASEPLDDNLIVLVEDRSMIKEPALLGHATIPVTTIEQRLDERLSTPGGPRVQRLPADGEATVEAAGGRAGARHHRSVRLAKGSTDAYCVTKYAARSGCARAPLPTASTHDGTSSTRGRCTTHALCSRLPCSTTGACSPAPATSGRSTASGRCGCACPRWRATGRTRRRTRCWCCCGRG